MAGHKFPMDYQYSTFLFYSSFSMGISAFIAHIMNDLYITVYLILLFLTSINLWRQPEYGIRRNIDVTMVSIGWGYSLLKLFLLNEEFNQAIILSLGICIIFFYAFEHLLYYVDSPKWIVFHMALHMYASCAWLWMTFD